MYHNKELGELLDGTAMVQKGDMPFTGIPAVLYEGDVAGAKNETTQTLGSFATDNTEASSQNFNDDSF